MAAATNIDRRDGFIVVAGGSFTLDPGSVAGDAKEDQTVAVPEARVGDGVLIQPRAALGNGLVVSAPHVSANGTITFTLQNTTAATPVDEGSATWDFYVIRGSVGRFD